MSGNTQKKKLLTKFDIVVIVVVILAAALFLAWRASQSDGGPITLTNTGTVRFTVELNNIPENVLSHISQGDTITDTAKNTHIGTVASYDVIKMLSWGTNIETGNIVETETDRDTLLLVIDAPCTITDSTMATRDGAIELRVGTSIGVSGPGYWGSGYIVAIERS